MKGEYVRLNIPERMYGRKNFYYTQLGLLNLIKSMKSYKSLRTEEMTLKIALKTKISELKVVLEKFEKIIPDVPEKEHKMVERAAKEEKRDLTLEEEIESIRHKISRLQIGL